MDTNAESKSGFSEWAKVELRAEARRKRLAASLEVISSGLLVLFLMAAVATGLGLGARVLVWLFNYGYRAF